jgi:tetratricopeptide (TPR) repeat protein
MTRVFVSHSNLDQADAERIFDWLKSCGFENGFLDIDKHQGIPPGAKWEQTLYRELERAQAVILILTANWHSSKWCFAEFGIARSLGKPIFPLIMSPDGDQYVGDDLQKVWLTGDWQDGLDRLGHRLAEVALESHGGFDLERDRPPFPGIFAFDTEDAAIYFGRDDDVRNLIQRLQANRINGGGRLLAVLGASGSGKSSLLRAGVLPRLRRDRRSWIIVPPFRPGLDPFRALIAALRAAGAKLPGRTSVSVSDLHGLADELRTVAGAHQATILLSIDQAEEIFTTTPTELAEPFWGLISAALQPDLPFGVVLTMRSDRLEDLQVTNSLVVPIEEVSLKPFPMARVGEIIRGPARVVGLLVADALVERMREDARTPDALPLVAFMLRKMYDADGGRESLTLAAYEAMRDASAGLSPLETAVRNTADSVLDRLKPDAPVLTALRNAFVPGMVAVSTDGSFVRRPAAWDRVPRVARPILEALAGPDARLLIIAPSETGTKIEVAHEALFRVWPLLAGWLVEERDFLIGLERLRTALADWLTLPTEERREGLLSGILLDRATIWLNRHPEAFNVDEQRFIADSRAAEDERRRRDEAQRRAVEESEKRRLMEQRDAANRMRRGAALAAVCLGIFFLMAAGAAFWAMNKQREAQTRQRELVGVLAQVSQTLSDDSVSSLLGFAPIERRLTGILLPEQQRAINQDESLMTPAETSDAWYHLGLSEEGTGNSEAASKDFDVAFDISQRNIETFARNTKLPPELATSFFRAFEMRSWHLMNTGDREKVAEAFRIASDVEQRTDLTNADVALLEADAGYQNSRSRFENERKSSDRGLASAEKAVALTQMALTKAPKSIPLQKDLSVFQQNVGISLQAIERPSDAQKWSNQACQIADKLLATHPLDPSVLYPAVACALL